MVALVAGLVPGGSGRGAGAGLPGAPPSALRVREPERLPGSLHASVWSVLRRPATARRAPSPAAPAVARLGTRAPEGTPNAVLVIGRQLDANGRLWVRVRLPVLPNNTTGWLPRSSIAGYGVVRTRLVVDRARLRATLLRDGRPVFRADVGIGLPAWPTPAGRFYVRSKLVRYSSPFYGPLAFGTSARSATLTDWPEGASSGSTAPTGPTCCRAGSRTAASGCATGTSSNLGA